MRELQMQAVAKEEKYVDRVRRIVYSTFLLCIIVKKEVIEDALY